MDITMCRVLKDGEDWWLERSHYTRLGRERREVVPRARQIAKQHSPSIFRVESADGETITYNSTYPSNLMEQLTGNRNILRRIQLKEEGSI